jgi:autophagy-related protein 2
LRAVQGIKDLIWMPIDQYRRDRRLVRGLQRGASSFSSSTAMATLDLANRIVYLIQSAAQFAHDVVTPPTPGHRQISLTKVVDQPRDMREGIVAGYAVMTDGFQDIIRRVANAGAGADGVSDVIGEVFRQIPATLVEPVITTCDATSKVLVGMRNQLTPEARKDDYDKYKNTPNR